MPKVGGRVHKIYDKDGKKGVWIRLSGAMPKLGELVMLKWGRGRSNSQNAFLWVFYDWLMDFGDLRHDFDTSEELHETMKAAFLSKRFAAKNGQMLTKIGSTTTLNKDEFAQFVEKVNKAVIEYYGINTAPFFKEYEELYSVR